MEPTESPKPPSRSALLPLLLLLSLRPATAGSDDPVNKAIKTHVSVKTGAARQVIKAFLDEVSEARNQPAQRLTICFRIGQVRTYGIDISGMAG